ncbi:hypothetical protein NPIL_314331 [Nephila pilipes]|uniref:Uncharacterized protein n=1 Tax=Nephila pilipes TaxID=299642 RepID=A0A8X6MGN8_NEPPI|nr:hypothetical protein NPIL_314331 [Nephila pilipes]
MLLYHRNHIENMDIFTVPYCKIAGDYYHIFHIAARNSAAADQERWSWSQYSRAAILCAWLDFLAKGKDGHWILSPTKCIAYPF